jgi:tetratricopeptide (TPR) repeat protein
LYHADVKESGSEQSTHSLNARLLRFRSQPGSEDPYALAEDLIAAKRYGDARGVAVSAQPGDQEDGYLLVLEGRAWLHERDLVRSQAALLRAIRAAPDYADAYRWLGHVLLKRGDPQRALKTLKRALELNPKDEESQKLAVRAEHLAETIDGETMPMEEEAASHSPPPATYVGRNPRQPGAPQPAGAKAPGSAGERKSPVEPTSNFRPIPGRPDMRAAQRGSGLMQSVKPAIPNPPDDPELGRYSAQNITAEQFVPPNLQKAKAAGQPLPRKPSPAATPAISRNPAGPIGRKASDGAGQREPPRSAGDRQSPGTVARASDPEPPRSAGDRQSPGTVARASVPEPPRSAGDRQSPGTVAQASVPAVTSPRAPSRPLMPRAEPQNAGAHPSGSRHPRASGVPTDVIDPRHSASPPAGTERPLIAATPVPDLPPLPDLPRGASPRPRARSSQPSAAAPESRRDAHASPVPPAAALETWDEREGVQLDPPSVPLSAADRAVGVPTLHTAHLRSAGESAADADAALALVKGYGLFEEPRATSAEWAREDEVEPKGTRVRNALIGLWVFTLASSVGGYFGWQAFVEQRHAKAAAWVQDARALMLRGDHAGLVDAERLLRLAREQHPASSDIPLEALLLQVERVLEDGERDLAALKMALGRAPVSTDGKAAQDVATAVIAAFGGDRPTRDKLLEQALAAAPGDARRLHLLGRLEERLGRPSSREHIEAASQADAKLMPAQLALAQIAFDQNEREEALRRVDAVLGAHKEHLRAQLLKLFITANDAEPKQVEATLDGLGDAMKLAGSVDEVLNALTRARVLRRQGKLDEAAAAIERAAALGVDEPRLLSWVAREALAVNKPALAQQAASRALSVAPDVAPYRRLLARVLIERSDGARARELLDKLPADDLEAQIMKAQAALLEDDQPVLQAALTALTQAPVDKASESAVQVGALKVRLESKLTPGKPVVDRAKALVKSAPGDPEALLALAEAGLAAHDPAVASGALKQRFAVAPDDPNAHYLLGRARRMAADAEGAEASFRKALTLSPGQRDSLVALGGLLLDQGKYEEADAVFQELSTRGGSALAGRLGRVEALVALGRTADAQVQLDAVPEAQRTTAAVRSAAARVALARHKPGDALSLIRPLLETQGDRPALQALYGDALLAAEQLEGASSAYDKALSLDSGLPEALLGRAQVQLRTNKAKDALPVLEAAKRALADRIRPPAMHALRAVLTGQAYLLRNKRGDADTAKQVLREAIKLSAAPPEAHFWLGEALGSKAAPEARTEYQRYLELAPNGKYADRARRALSSLS